MFSHLCGEFRGQSRNWDLSWRAQEELGMCGHHIKEFRALGPNGSPEETSSAMLNKGAPDGGGGVSEPEGRRDRKETTFAAERERG